MTKQSYSVDFTPICAQVRVYEQYGSYANRDKYIGVATIQYLTSDTVYISGTLGMITAEIRALVFNKLKEAGIKHVHYERNGIQQQVEL